MVRARVAALPGSERHEHFLEYGETDAGGARSGEIKVLGCVEITGTIENPQIVELPVTVSKSGGRKFGVRQRQHNNRDATRRAFLREQTRTGKGPKTGALGRLAGGGRSRHRDVAASRCQLDFSQRNVVDPAG